MEHTDFIGAGGACLLPHWGVLRAAGEDSASFLHSQLTNDVVKLGRDQARWAAFCSAQGRMSASFVVSKRGPEEVWLACAADVLAATQKRLSMFVLRSKVMLRDAGGELAVVGLAGAAAEVWLAAQGDAAAPVVADAPAWTQAELLGGALVRLPSADQRPRWLWIGTTDAAQTLTQALPPLPLPLWQWLEVRSGVVQVVAATSGQFVPQMLNYELVGGVDFKKGCYPGQEIVARSHYLGKLKRRAFLVDTAASLEPGQEVYWSGDSQQPAGVVALAAPHPRGGFSAIVELKLGAVDSGTLHLGRADGPAMTLQALPYSLPQQDAATPAA
jgi:folate-binding protein YgfZ